MKEWIFVSDKRPEIYPGMNNEDLITKPLEFYTRSGKVRKGYCVKYWYQDISMDVDQYEAMYVWYDSDTNEEIKDEDIIAWR